MQVVEVTVSWVIVWCERIFLQVHVVEWVRAMRHECIGSDTSSIQNYLFAVTQHTNDTDVFVAFGVVALHVDIQKIARQEASVHYDRRSAAIASEYVPSAL